ncbi:MAG: hypothetical protein WC374_09825 [Phycisphaerae bacterium]|jgi:hypothetical protein
MRTAILIISWLIVAEGVLFLIWPGLLCTVLRFFRNSFWMYMLSLLRIALSILFLFGAAQSRVSIITGGFGVLLLIAGAAGLVMKQQMYNTIALWWQERRLITVRITAAFVMLTGAVLIYCT